MAAAAAAADAATTTDAVLRCRQLMRRTQQTCTVRKISPNLLAPSPSSSGRVCVRACACACRRPPLGMPSGIIHHTYTHKHRSPHGLYLFIISQRAQPSARAPDRAPDRHRGVDPQLAGGGSRSVSPPSAAAAAAANLPRGRHNLWHYCGTDRRTNGSRSTMRVRRCPCCRRRSTMTN